MTVTKIYTMPGFFWQHIVIVLAHSSLSRSAIVVDRVKLFLTVWSPCKSWCCFSYCVRSCTCKRSQKFCERWALPPPWDGAWL